jgi:dual-specificity kinase
MAKNNYRAFPPTIVRDLSVQICSAVQFLHNLSIIFTDLKPENIVFIDGRTKQYLINGKTHHLPVDTRIKVVDFGSAVYEPKYDPKNRATWRFRHGYNYLIQTRHYRAPEVVLEMCWKRPVDVWSIGCVMLEFLFGSMVFNTHCPIDHLNQMQNMIGPIPVRLIEQASERKMYELFHPETLTLRLAAARRSRAQARQLDRYFDFRIPEYKDLYDLVARMLQWFAADRIDADTIMRHSYWAASDPRYKRSMISGSTTASTGSSAATGEAATVVSAAAASSGHARTHSHSHSSHSYR